MSWCGYVPWPLFRCSVVAAFGCSVTTIFKLLARILPRPKPPVTENSRVVGGGIRVTTSVTQYTREESQARAANEHAARLRKAAKEPKPQLSVGATMVRLKSGDQGELMRSHAMRLWEVSDALKRNSTLYHLVLESGQPAYILMAPEHEYIQVLTPPKADSYTNLGPSDFHHFGFSRYKSSWTYGKGPYRAREIRAALRTLDPTIQGRERT
jgi:hypothetical protein